MNVKNLIPIAILLFLVEGCAVVKQSVFLQNTEISGPINQPALHITENQKKNTITFSPNIFINTQKNYKGQVNGHTNVNSSGVFQIDTIYNGDGTVNYKESPENKYVYSGQNLNWSLPNVQVGFQIDVALFDHLAVSGGLNYSESNRDKLISGNAGIGFFTDKDNSAVRFDIGMLFQNTFYTTSSVVITTISPAFGSDKSYVSFFRDRGNSTATDFFSTFTYNTTGRDNLVNFYFSLGYFGQTIMNYKPENMNSGEYPFSNNNIEQDTRGDVFTSFLYFAPGVYKDFEDWGRISIGIRLLKETKISNSSNSLFVVPAAQFDMVF